MKKLAIVMLCVLVAIISVSCSNSKTETASYTWLTPTFSVDIPGGWIVDEDNLEIYEENGDAKVVILVFNSPAEEDLVDFVDLYKEMLIAWGQFEDNPETVFLSEAKTQVDNSSAVSLVYLASGFSDGVVMKHLTTLFQHQESFYAIECSTDVDSYEEYHDQFRTITESFKEVK